MLWGLTKLFGQLTLAITLACAAAFLLGFVCAFGYVAYEALTKWNH